MSTPLVVIGDFAWDVLIRTNSELLKGGDTFGEVMLTPGGSAANVAVWAKRCGLETAFVGKIGRDKFGLLAREDLKKEGVKAHFIQTDAHLTGSVAVFVDHTGERSMVSGHGADFYVMPSEVPKQAIEQSQHLHLTAWSFFTDPPRAAARSAAKWAQATGATLSLDPGSFQMIQEMSVRRFLKYTQDLGVDIFMPNKEEGEMLTGFGEPEKIAAALSELYENALIVLKLDADGSLVYGKGKLTEISPVNSNLIDATGAGDSFAGAFLSRYLQHGDAVKAAKFATEVSAWVIEHLGARPTVDKQLERIIAN